MALIEGIQTSLWGKESNGAFPSCWHWFASRLALKGSFAAPSGAPLTAAARCEPRPTMEGKGETATSPSLTNLALFRVHAVVRSKKYLTPPALLERRCYANDQAEPLLLEVNPSARTPAEGYLIWLSKPRTSSLLVVHRGAAEFLALRIGSACGDSAGLAISRHDDSTSGSNFGTLLDREL